jgi:protease IV
MRELLAHVAIRGSLRERSVEPYVRLLRGLRDRRRFKGVLLDISSPGGEVVPSTDLFLAVQRLNARTPVFASIGGIGASGGYLAALGARKVYAYPESLVGSIGVVYPHIAVRELVRRLGISVDLLHVGEHKDAFQGYRPLTEVEREKMLAVAQDDYDLFVEAVAGSRHRPVEEIRALATGEVWSGRRAHALGLVDALGDRETALEDLARSVGVAVGKTVRLAPPRTLLERFFASGARGFSSTLVDRVTDRLEESLLGLGGPGAGW